MPSQISVAAAVSISALVTSYAHGQSALQPSPGFQVDETVTPRFYTGGLPLPASCDSLSLVLTTSSDPDWVVATSEIWLDDSGCTLIDACGLEQAALIDDVAALCEEESHRFFKLPAGENRSGMINGFDPNLSDGFQTYDSLFVRAGTTIQIYAPKNFANPDGKEYVRYGDPITGPVMVTIDIQNWSLACHPPVTGDINLPDFFGGPGEIMFGQMVYWPFSIGESAEVISVDTTAFEDGNAETNHTSGFVEANVPKLMVRRASTFDIEVRLSESFPGSLPLVEPCEDLLLIAKDMIDETEYQIPRLDIQGTDWSFTVTNLVVDPADNSRVLTCRVRIPLNAPIGEYEFRPLLVAQGAQGEELLIEQDVLFPEPIVILFNPWGLDPEVFFTDHAALDSDYINGDVFIFANPKVQSGNLRDRVSWGVDQFEEQSVEFLLQIVQSLSNPEDRASAKSVARHMAEQMSPAGEGLAVIKGRWPTTAELVNPVPGQPPLSDSAWFANLCAQIGAGCTSPFDWHKSSRVISEFLTNGGPVQYGQCWVFAGVLGTALRTAGIPCRPITCISAGFERSVPFNGATDYYYETVFDFVVPRRGNTLLPETIQRSDDDWLFHVWQEAWLASGGGAPTWHALDATPVEYDPGLVRAVVGPVLVTDIRDGTLGQNFDIDVFLTAVKGDVQHFREGGLADPDVFVEYFLNSHPRVPIGNHIDTQEVGRLQLQSVLSSYKTPPSPQPAGSSGDVNVAFLFPASAAFGDDAPLGVLLENTTASPRTIVIDIAATLDGAPGFHEVLFSETRLVSLAPGGSATSMFIVPSAVLRIAAANTVLALTLSGQINVIETGQLEIQPFWGIEVQTDITNMNMPVTSTGHPLALHIEYTNLNDFDADEVMLTVYLPDELAINGSQKYENLAGVVSQGATKVWDISVEGSQAGEFEIDAFVTRKGSFGSNASSSVMIIDCPADLAEPFGVLDFTDVITFLTAYDAQDPIADFSETFGEFDFDDVLAFLTSYGSGCFD